MYVIINTISHHLSILFTMNGFAPNLSALWPKKSGRKPLRKQHFQSTIGDMMPGALFRL